MNRGLYFYGIMLVTIATIVFSVNEFGVAHATTGIDLGNNPVQSNQVPDLKSNPNDNDDNNNDQSSSNNNNNNNNDDNNNDQSSSNNNNNNNNDDNNNDQSGSSSTSTSSSSSSSSSSSQDDVPMALPFNSNVADESDDEEDYTSVIPFP